MGLRIQQLPPLIANQIAAGEVIERPASVVKELLENALDAKADAITIEIGYGGLNQIKISDNGVGIIAEDLPLAVAAHATSKIKVLNDLYAIDSMGFRGEALASISSIAKVTISSKPTEQDTAMMLRVQGAQTVISPCARTQGTTIEVSDLFFNAPVRKRFLKSEKLEFQAIETVVKRFALSAPNISLTLKHNGKQILLLPAALNEQAQLIRMTRIFGTAFVKEAIFFDVERGAMRLYGWVSGANYQRSQNDRQWVYINQRMVKDKLLNHAIKQAYDGVLHPGRFPACILYLTINHAEVDVNVHPTKHEVRFQQPRLVHDFFTSQLIAALQSNNKEQSYQLPQGIPQQEGAICEPYPQLGTFNQVINPPQAEVSWFFLHAAYVVTWIKQQPYIVNLMALYKDFLHQQLITLSLPLKSRPLLVPLRYALPYPVIDRTMLIENLSQLGITMEVSCENEALIRTIPLSVPYLDLRLFLDAVIELQDASLSQLIELMSQSQIFAPQMLSHEEKMELNQVLISAQNKESQKAGLFKAITSEDCWNLLHV